MLNYAWIFLVIAIIAAIFGFSGNVGATAGIPKMLFYLFLVFFVAIFLTGRKRV
jgi:uncharacterized membrane protein YtjA (UPF0391 family)